MLHIGSVVLGALLIGPGIYLFVLTQRFEKPGNDIGPLLRKGGYVLLGSGFALATTFVWLAMPYFMGTSCNMALMALYLGTPVVMLLLIFGAMALYEARMR